MKKVINILGIVLLIASIPTFGQCCNSSTNHGAAISNGRECSNPQEKSEVKAYYFHSTRRCATCLAVEDVTVKTIKEKFEGKIPFQSIDIEADENNPLIAKYKISGQTLLIIKGDKVVDLTNEAFINARTSPEKLEAKIKKTIDSM